MGDRIDLYGLHLIFLGTMFVCVAFAGVMRIAGTGGEIAVLQNGAEGRKYDIVPAGGTLIEREWEREQELYTGEVQILTPASRTKMAEAPMLLSIGPSLTMVLPMIVMALAGSRMMGQGNNFYMISVLTGLCSAALAVFGGFRIGDTGGMR